MNNYYFKKDKTIEILNKIKDELIINKENLNEAFELDFKEWELKIEFEKLVDIVESFENKQYLPKFTKEKVVDGLGKIALISNQNPYLVLNFILSSIYTNNKVNIILDRKMLASNKAIIECVKKCIKKLKLDADTIEYKEVSTKDEFIKIQDKFDLLYYLGNKEEYLKFIKRIHIDSKFENFGEIYIYLDTEMFNEVLIDIDRFAYINEINVQYFNENLDKSIEIINSKNNINKNSIIFTKDINNAYNFIKKVKSENVYVNINPCDEFQYDINMNNLVYTKKIMIKK